MGLEEQAGPREQPLTRPGEAKGAGSHDAPVRLEGRGSAREEGESSDNKTITGIPGRFPCLPRCSQSLSLEQAA